MTNNDHRRLIAPIWDDANMSRASVAMSALSGEAMKLSGLLTARGADHHVLLQIADVYRAMDDAADALDKLEKQVRGGRASADERQAVAKVKAGLR